MQGERFTVIAGTSGFIATLALPEINTIVSVLVGVATLVFIVTRWIIFVKTYGGFRRLFSLAPDRPLPSHRAHRCDDCPVGMDHPDRPRN